MVRGQREAQEQSVPGHQNLGHYLPTSELQNGMFW